MIMVRSLLGLRMLVQQGPCGLQASRSSRAAFSPRIASVSAATQPGKRPNGRRGGFGVYQGKSDPVTTRSTPIARIRLDDCLPLRGRRTRRST